MGADHCSRSFGMSWIEPCKRGKIPPWSIVAHSGDRPQRLHAAIGSICRLAGDVEASSIGTDALHHISGLSAAETGCRAPVLRRCCRRWADWRSWSSSQVCECEIKSTLLLVWSGQRGHGRHAPRNCRNVAVNGIGHFFAARSMTRDLKPAALPGVMVKVKGVAGFPGAATKITAWPSLQL